MPVVRTLQTQVKGDPRSCGRQDLQLRTDVQCSDIVTRTTREAGAQPQSLSWRRQNSSGGSRRKGSGSTVLCIRPSEKSHRMSGPGMTDPAEAGIPFEPGNLAAVAG